MKKKKKLNLVTWSIVLIKTTALIKSVAPPYDSLNIITITNIYFFSSGEELIMKITGTVREFVEIGIIPNDTILNSFMDSIVEIVPSTEDLEKLVKGINSSNNAKKTKEMKNIAYAMDVNSEVTCIAKNLFCVEATLIPSQFLSKEGVDESKIDLKEILHCIFDSEDTEEEVSEQLDELFSVPNLPPVFFIAKA